MVNFRTEGGNAEAATQEFNRETMAALLDKLGRAGLLDMLDLVVSALKNQS